MSLPKSQFNVAIVAPTCFYYQAPMFRELAAHPQLNLIVFFCSDEGNAAQDIREMYKVDAKWTESANLLEGFRSKLLRNISPRPSYLRWPFGLVNVGIIKEIFLRRPDVVILMSWMNPTWWMALVSCVILKIPFFFLTDTNVQIEPLRSPLKRRIKQILLGNLLFKLCSGFLCAGTANRLFYAMYGVPERKLFPFAYSWGYQALRDQFGDIASRRSQIRDEFGIPEQNLVIMYCGRLSREKNLFNLIYAYHRLNSDHISLIFVGDGELRESLQDYVVERSIGSVHFFGFQNRDHIGKYYAIADVLVLPSLRETWGIVVNEAMCFGLPVIVSHQVGSGIDLVIDGYNGYSVAMDVDSLSRSIKQLAELSEEERLLMGTNSVEIMMDWSNRDLARSLIQYIECARP